MATTIESAIDKVCDAAARANSLNEQTRKTDREAFSVLQSVVAERCSDLRITCHLQNPFSVVRAGAVVYHVELLLKQAPEAPSTSVLHMQKLLYYIPLSASGDCVAKLDTTRYDEATNSFVCAFEFHSSAKKQKSVVIARKRVPTSTHDLRTIKKSPQKESEHMRPRRNQVALTEKTMIRPDEDEIDDLLAEEAKLTAETSEDSEKATTVTEKLKRSEKTSWWKRFVGSFSLWRSSNDGKALSEEDKKILTTFEFQPSLFVVDG